VLATWLSWLIIRCGDIERNPGPVKWPCPVCNKSASHSSIQCKSSQCKKWHHLKCVDISWENITWLVNSEGTRIPDWMCPDCQAGQNSSHGGCSLDTTNADTPQCETCKGPVHKQKTYYSCNKPTCSQISHKQEECSGLSRHQQRTSLLVEPSLLACKLSVAFGSS
jgi:hypothetical protein